MGFEFFLIGMGHIFRETLNQFKIKKIASLLLVTLLLVGTFASPNLNQAHANFGTCAFSLDTYGGDAPLTVTIFYIQLTVGGSDYNSGSVKFSIAIDGQWSDYVSEPVKGPSADAPDKTVVFDQPGDHTIQFRCEHSSGQTIDSGVVDVTVSSPAGSQPSPSPPTTPVPVPTPTPTPSPPTTPTPAPTPAPQPETITGFVKADSSRYFTTEEYNTPVKITGQVNGGRGETVVLTITKPDGTLDVDQTFLTGTGAFSSIYMLDKDSPLGNYKLDASYSGTVFGSTSFNVLSLPSSPITLTANDVNGQVEVQQPDGTWIPVTEGMEIQNGQTVSAQNGGSVTLTLSDYQKILLKDSTMTLEDKLIPTMNLKNGLMRILDNFVDCIKKAVNNSSCRTQVTTPWAAVSVRGTDVAINYDSANQVETIYLNEGAIAVTPTATNQTSEYTGPQTIVVDNTGMVSANPLSAEKWDLVANQISPTSIQSVIPSWIKNNAKWWAAGQVSDADFIKGVQYLVQQGIITVPPTQGTTSQSQAMPVWVKNTAKWWALGQVTDADFIKSIQYLVQNGIIVVQTSTTSITTPSTTTPSTTTPSTTTPSTTTPSTTPAQYNTFHNHGISFSYPSDWTVQDLTQNNVPDITIHSGDSSVTITISELSTSNRFGGATGQDYLNQLIAYMQDFCNSNSFCSDLKLTNSKVASSSSEQAYVATFNFIFTDKSGTKTNATMAQLDLPTSSGTWMLNAVGPSTNYASYSQQITNIVSSIAFDQTAPTQQGYNAFHNYGFSVNYPTNWTVEDRTASNNGLANVGFHSDDQTLVVAIGQLASNNRFNASGQAYVDDLVKNVESNCNSYSICTNLVLTSSNVISSPYGPAYLASFNYTRFDNQNNPIPEAHGFIELPTNHGTWWVQIIGPYSSVVSHTDQMNSMISSLKLDQP